MYVIRRSGDGKFVANSGSKNSYTSSLQNARVYASRSDAERDKCGNEYVVSVSDLLTR